MSCTPLVTSMRAGGRRRTARQPTADDARISRQFSVWPRVLVDRLRRTLSTVGSPRQFARPGGSPRRDSGRRRYGPVAMGDSCTTCICGTTVYGGRNDARIAIVDCHPVAARFVGDAVDPLPACDLQVPPQWQASACHHTVSYTHLTLPTNRE